MPTKVGGKTKESSVMDNKQKDAFYKYKDIVYSRISTQRQQLHKIAYEEAEEKRRQLILHRIQWRSTIKGQRLAQLDRQLDEFLLRDADSILQKQSTFTSFRHNDSKLCDWSYILSELDNIKKENGLSAVSSSCDIPIEIGSASKIRGSITRQLSSSKQLSNYVNTRKLPMTKSFVGKFCDGQGSEMAISTNNTILSRLLLSHNYVRHKSLSVSIVDGEKGSFMVDASNDQNHFEVDDAIPKLTLVDSIFLVGPQGDDIIDIAHAFASDPAATKGGIDFVEPKMIYTAGSEPDAELEILPFFCFPNWISATCSYLDTLQKPTISRSFVFQLTAVDGFVQFAVCLLLSRTFKVNVGGVDEKFVYCTTDYCVCAVTRTPFINYIQYILQQCDRLGWLLIDVQSPLPIYDQVPRYSMHNSLRTLDELNSRLKRIVIPQLRNYTLFSEDEVEDDEVKPIEFWLPWRLADGSTSLQSQKKVNFVLHRNAQERFYRIINMTENDSDNHSKMTRTIDDSMVADRETIFNVLLWSLPTLLRHLPLHQIVLVLGCILGEMRIIIHSQDLSVVSGVLLALVHLLRPLKWAGPIIVTLPPSLNTFLESPVPLILGMRSLPVGYKAEAGMIVINPSNHSVDLHPTDVVVSHTLTLPNASTLVSALRASAEAILRLSKKAEVSDAPSSDDDKTIPVPIELNIQGQKGKHLLLAIATFANTVETHILSIINTAVQDSWDQRFHDRKSTSPNSSSPSQPHNFDGDVQTNLMRTQQSDYGFSDESETLLDGEDLPPVEHNVPLLPTDLGKHKSSKQFISRLQNTQMFSNYCRFASVEYKKRMSLMTSGKSKSSTSGSVKDINIDDLNLSTTSVPIRSEKTVFPADVIIPSNSSPSMATSRKRSSSIKSENLDPANDPLVILFSIMLTGTIPNLGKSALQSQDKHSLWCNGRCYGLANTPHCTSICLKLWEERVLIARKNEEVKKISAKLFNEKVFPKRHPNETQSQFDQRLAIIQQFSIVKDEEIKTKHRIRKSRIKYYKRKLYLRYLKEHRRLNESAIIIQSLHRAYSVRKDIPALVYSLRERKDKRCQAAVAIQHFLRKTPFVGSSDAKKHQPPFGEGTNTYSVKKIFPEVEGNDASSSSPLLIRHEEIGNRYRHTQTAAKNLSDKAQEILKTFVSIQEQRHSQHSRHNKTSISPQTVSRDDGIKDISEDRENFIRGKGNVIATGAHDSFQTIRRISMTSNSAITITEGNLVASDIYNDPKQKLSIQIEGNNTLEISTQVERLNNTPKQVGFTLPGESLNISRVESIPIEDFDEPDFSALLDDNAITMDERRFAPIDNLGPAAKDAFTPQQRAIVIEMWSLLNRGIQVLKHAKSGRPHKRYLFCNTLMTKLYWRVHLEDQEESHLLPNDVRVETRNQSLVNRHDPPPREKRKTILSAFQRVDADRELFLDQIVEVRDDISTEVMRRSYAKQFMNWKASSCIISILLHDRSLDFEVEERYWGCIFHALQIMVNYYREVLPTVVEKTQVVVGQRKL